MKVSVMENEIWLPAKGYEGIYEVSSNGRLKRLVTKKGVGYPKKERILKGRIDVYGYYRFCLAKDGKFTNIKVHRLVAMSFIHNPKNLQTVNHKDGNKANNCVSNLEWMSQADNNKHAYVTGLKNNTGKMNGRAKITPEQVLEIYHSNELQKDLAKRFNVTQTLISAIKTRKNWTHITCQALAS